MINIIKLLSTQKHRHCFAQLRSKYDVNFISTPHAKVYKKRPSLLCGLVCLIITRGMTCHHTAYVTPLICRTICGQVL